MKSCFEGYLTSKCKDCEFWKNGTTDKELGCACPFPISYCEAFSKECEGKSGAGMRTSEDKE